MQKRFAVAELQIDAEVVRDGGTGDLQQFVTSIGAVLVPAIAGPERLLLLWWFIF